VLQREEQLSSIINCRDADRQKYPMALENTPSPAHATAAASPQAILSFCPPSEQLNLEDGARYIRKQLRCFQYQQKYQKKVPGSYFY